MDRSDKPSIMRRVSVVQLALCTTAVLRLVDAERAAELSREEAASISGSGVEGNARVVGGFVSLLFKFVSWISILHAGVSLVVVAALFRVVRMVDAPSAVDWMRRTLAAYLWAGVVLGMVVGVLTYGWGIIVMVVPVTLGLWGAVVAFLALLVPAVTAWQARRRDEEDAPFSSANAHAQHLQQR